MGDFIHFGCWNNVASKKSCFKQTFSLLNRYLDTHEVDMLSVSGDNFYPSKIKDTVFKEGRLIKESDSKVALIHETPLAAGFQALNNLHHKIGPKGIKMILGNHDLQTGKKLIVSKEYEYNVDRDDFEIDASCNIIQWELKNQGNIDLDITHVTTYSSPGFKKQSPTHVETLILMIDTSMFSDAKEIAKNNYVQCYNIFLQEKHPGSQYTIEELRAHQLSKIVIQLGHYTYDNLILIGHHPILTVKSKKEAVEDAEGNVTKEWRMQHTEDMPEFKEFFKHVAPHIKTERIYYLCADLHLYQHGLMTIHTGGREYRIQQYVVGTGGTELDDEYKHRDGRTMDMGELQSQRFVKETDDFHVVYQIIDYKKECGFLVCHLKDGISFEFCYEKKGGRRTRVKNRVYNGRARLSRRLT